MTYIAFIKAVLELMNAYIRSYHYFQKYQTTALNDVCVCVINMHSPQSVVEDGYSGSPKSTIHN